MGRHNLKPRRPRTGQWALRPLPKRKKAHPGRRWAVGVGSGVGVVAVTFWGTGPNVAASLPLASADSYTGSTVHPELLPGSGSSLHAALGLNLGTLDAGVASAPDLLKVALAQPLHVAVPSVTIGVHPTPDWTPGPAPVVRPPCPDPVRHPGAYRAWWARWFPHQPPPVVTTPPPTSTPPAPSTPEPEPTHEDPPPVVISVPTVDPTPEPEPTQEPEPTHEPDPEPTSEPEPTHESEPTSDPEPEHTDSSDSDSESKESKASDDSDSSSSSSDHGDSDSSDSSSDSSSSSDKSDSSSGSDSGSDSGHSDDGDHS